MLVFDIPGREALRIEHLLLDYNGTIAFDGLLIAGVEEILNSLADNLSLHVITADTFGTVRERVAGIRCHVETLPPGEQDMAKANYLRQIGANATVALGNGRNDRTMLREAALGIALIQREGASAGTLLESDIVCHSVLDALELLRNPLRLTATLRN